MLLGSGDMGAAALRAALVQYPTHTYLGVDMSHLGTFLAAWQVDDQRLPSDAADRSVHAHGHTRTHTQAHTHVHTHTRAHTHMQTHTHTRTEVQTHKHTHAQTHTYIDIH